MLLFKKNVLIVK